MIRLRDCDTNQLITFDSNSPYAHLRGSTWRVGRKSQTDLYGRFIVCSCVYDGNRENLLTGETRMMHYETEVGLGD